MKRAASLVLALYVFFVSISLLSDSFAFLGEGFAIMSVVVLDAYTGNALPDALFTTRVDRSLGQGDYVYAVSSDGQRFLVNVAPERPPSFEYTVLLAWREALSGSDSDS